jgi:DNA (cytosine-5)-methyltransferase 1
LRYFSLFSGIGGFELGFPESWINVGYSEIDKYALAIYKYHFPEEINYGDATKINTNKIPEFDILASGFPCQAFSCAGKRMGFEDTRGTLFFEIARIIKEKRPQTILLENVRGLLSHARGRTFAVILSVLDELRYHVEWEVLNSKNYGVPQNRERVFIVGHSRGLVYGRPQVFPLGRDAKENLPSSQKEVGKDLSFALDSNYWKGPCELTLKKSRRQLIMATKRIYSTMTPYKNTKSQHGRRSKDDNEPMFTLTSDQAHIHGVTIEDEECYSIRRLTPIECERLQGFPDNWTKYGISAAGEKIEISDRQRYKTLGNAVTVNVIKAISEKMEAVLSKSE